MWAIQENKRLSSMSLLRNGNEKVTPFLPPVRLTENTNRRKASGSTRGKNTVVSDN